MNARTASLPETAATIPMIAKIMMRFATIDIFLFLSVDIRIAMDYNTYVDTFVSAH